MIGVLLGVLLLLAFSRLPIDRVWDREATSGVGGQRATHSANTTTYMRLDG